MGDGKKKWGDLIGCRASAAAPAPAEEFLNKVLTPPGWRPTIHQEGAAWERNPRIC
jgi:hypothetical protein